MIKIRLYCGRGPQRAQVAKPMSSRMWSNDKNRLKIDGSLFLCPSMGDSFNAPASAILLSAS